MDVKKRFLRSDVLVPDEHEARLLGDGRPIPLGGAQTWATVLLIKAWREEKIASGMLPDIADDLDGEHIKAVSPAAHECRELAQRICELAGVDIPRRRPHLFLE